MADPAAAVAEHRGRVLRASAIGIVVRRSSVAGPPASPRRAAIARDDRWSWRRRRLPPAASSERQPVHRRDGAIRVGPAIIPSRSTGAGVRRACPIDARPLIDSSVSPGARRSHGGGGTMRPLAGQRIGRRHQRIRAATRQRSVRAPFEAELGVAAGGRRRATGSAALVPSVASSRVAQRRSHSLSLRSLDGDAADPRDLARAGTPAPAPPDDRRSWPSDARAPLGARDQGAHRGVGSAAQSGSARSTSSSSPGSSTSTSSVALEPGSLIVHGCDRRAR